MNDRTTALVARLADSLFEGIQQDADLVRGWRGSFDIELLKLLRAVALVVLSRWFAAENQRLCAEAKARGFVVERHPKIRFLTLFGHVSTNSSYFRRTSDGQGFRPLNAHYEVQGSRSTIAVQRALTDFGMERSFADASKAFAEHYGVEVGTTTVQNITERHARRIRDEFEQWCQAAPEPPRSRRADVMVLAMDGCALRVTERVPAGCIGRKDLPRNQPVRVDRWVDVRLAKARRDGDATGVFVCKYDTFDTVLDSLEGAAKRCGMTDETQLLFLGDGGNGLMEAAMRRFPTARFILDRCHLRHHLFGVVEHIGTHPDAVRQLVDIFDAAIGSGQAWRVINELRVLVPADVPGKPIESCPITNLINYLHRFEDAVQYDEFEANGWPTGSGEIESGHRQVPQARLKIPGAAWTPANLNAMAATRAARESGLWDQFWPKAA